LVADSSRICYINFLFQEIKKATQQRGFFLVEMRGIEPLTS